LCDLGAVKANLGQHMPLDEEGFAVSGEQLVALEKVGNRFLDASLSEVPTQLITMV
jgi:hypothetical protein